VQVAMVVEVLELLNSQMQAATVRQTQAVAVVAGRNELVQPQEPTAAQAALA
jgi:hypothetical protein